MLTDKHPIDREAIMAYLDGELEADQASLAAKHLEHCQECQRWAAEIRGLSRSLMAWEIPSSTTEIGKETEAALVDRARPPKRLSVSRVRRLAPWGLSLAGAVLVVWLTSPIFIRGHRQIKLSPNFMAPEEAIGRAPNSSVTEFERLERFTKLQKPSRVSAVPASDNPMIVQTAQVVLTTREFEKTRTGIEDALKRRQGYPSDLNVSSPAGSARTMTETLRVPADRLDDLIADIRKLGRVELESRGADDVTRQYVDLDAALSNARNTEQRLTDVLRQRTGKLQDVLAVEVEISRVRGEIERMEAERKSLVTQVNFASLNLRLTEVYRSELQAAPDGTAAKLRNAAVDGYRGMIGGLVGVALFVASYGPSLLLWGGLLFFPVRFSLRAFQKRR